jgi:hypothetical protein
MIWLSHLSFTGKSELSEGFGLAFQVRCIIEPEPEYIDLEPYRVD